MFNELTPVDWAVQILLNTPGITALVGDRIDADDNVPPMTEDDDQNPALYFPRIVYNGTPDGVPWASSLILGFGDFNFRAVTREDAVPNGADQLSFTVAIAQAIENALTGAPNPLLLGNGRTVHGAELIGIHAPPRQGLDGKRICERGRIFRLTWS